MTSNITAHMLLAASFLTGFSVETTANTTLPEHLTNAPRTQRSLKFKSAPASEQYSEPAAECAVFIKLPEDLGAWIPDICVACAEGKPLINPNGEYLYLSPGVYDIVARFTHSNPLSFTFNDYQGYVVLENVEVTGDMTIEVDPSTITNHIEFQPLLPDGTPMTLPVINLDEEGNEIPVSEGSMPFSGLTIIDYINGPGWGMDSSVGMSALINAETPWGFYDPTLMFGIHINDVSERIHLGIGTWVGTPEFDMAKTLIMIAEQAGSESGTISNDAAAYSVRTFDPAWTAAGAGTNDLIAEYPNDLNWITPYGYAIRRVSGDLNRLTSGSIMVTSKNPEIYSMAFSRNQIADPTVHLLVAPTKTELVKVGSDVVQTTNFGTWQQPFNEGEWLVYPQTALAQTPASPTADFPFNGVELFLTPVDDNEDTAFLTAPLVSTTIKRGFNVFEGTEYFGFSINCTGRMGETRNTDLTTMEAELRVNGVKVANSMSAIEEWWKGYESDMAGETELKLTDANFEIDGVRTATVSTACFDMRNADFFPPALTMMQVRSADGKLTSRLEPNQNNKILISAGDFEAGTEMINYYGETATITSEPASLSLWYAPAGSDEWTSLDYTKATDEVIPGIGTIYEADFSSDAAGWKDVKVRVEDAAGNWVEQVIGMAVYVKEMTGVHQFSRDNEVMVSGNNIIAPANAEIWTIDGMRSNGLEVNPGIYLVRVGNNTYKVAVK